MTGVQTCALPISKARKLFREQKALAKNISFNSWLIKCISHAVEEFKQIHGVRKGKRKLVIFEDVDISIVIEREVEGKQVPLPYVIRKANHKSIADIFKEIKSGREQSIAGEEDYVLGKKENKLMAKMYYWMPGFVRRMVWTAMIKSPFLTKQNMGTMMVTSVGMVGQINGWLIPVSIHPLALPLVRL